MINKFRTASLGNVFAVMLMAFFLYAFAEIFRPGIIISYINLQILLLLLLVIALLLNPETASSENIILNKFVLLLVAFSVGGIIYLLYQGSLLGQVLLSLSVIGLLIFIIFNVRSQNYE